MVEHLDERDGPEVARLGTVDEPRVYDGDLTLRILTMAVYSLLGALYLVVGVGSMALPAGAQVPHWPPMAFFNSRRISSSSCWI
jgi:hypothetical protein